MQALFRLYRGEQARFSRRQYNPWFVKARLWRTFALFRQHAGTLDQGQ
jgi:hypothetical protein